MINNYPYNNINTYRQQNGYPNNQVYYQDDRSLLVPFLFGGVAGTALGYGIANNNMYNQRPNYYYPPVYFRPYPPIGVPYYYN